MDSPIKAFIGLGSNLEDPRQQVLTAIQQLSKLDGTKLLQQSSLYRSDPVGPANQPDFINAVVSIQTRFTPLALLDQLQAIEQLHRRVRKEHWGPRTLDLDLLLYDNQTIALPRLTVPHPFLTQRNFVLYPLAEISPELYLPDGSLLSTILARCLMGSLQRLDV
ncbi:MAG: 2-amino-4-hydroxy-6-hydroxymethyldihydropteridine diphosphokinase [Motiliproteus sp.]